LKPGERDNASLMPDSLHHMGLDNLSHPCPSIHRPPKLLVVVSTSLKFTGKTFFTAMIPYTCPTTHFMWNVKCGPSGCNFVIPSFFLTCQMLLNQLCLPLESPGIFTMMCNAKCNFYNLLERSYFFPKENMWPYKRFSWIIQSLGSYKIQEQVLL
jgi:hypothetical protein